MSPWILNIGDSPALMCKSDALLLMANLSSSVISTIFSWTASIGRAPCARVELFFHRGIYATPSYRQELFFLHFFLRKSGKSFAQENQALVGYEALVH
jgi:hypothetical protein